MTDTPRHERLSHAGHIQAYLHGMQPGNFCNDKDKRSIERSLVHNIDLHLPLSI